MPKTLALFASFFHCATLNYVTYDALFRRNYSSQAARLKILQNFLFLEFFLLQISLLLTFYVRHLRNVN